MKLNPWCLSSYLGLRYVANEHCAWCEGVVPRLPRASASELRAVATADDILSTLRDELDRTCDNGRVGILLSSGIDSAILAALLPRGAPAYTIRFEAPGAVDESIEAEVYARHCGLEHRVVTVTWADFEAHMGTLMARKRSPLHPVEVGLYVAAAAASGDGVRQLVVGNGADSTFGGLDKLLSIDWEFDEFVRRYTFVDPIAALAAPVGLRSVYEPYRRGAGIDVVRFLKFVHGKGIVQAFDNAISAAGVASIEPYETLALAAPLDLARIRSGESKYLLREVFAKLYPDMSLPHKIAFARPLDAWLCDWGGPRRDEFLPNLDISEFTGEQRFLLLCLERFLDLATRGRLE